MEEYSLLYLLAAACAAVATRAALLWRRRRHSSLHVGEFVAVLGHTGAVALHGFVLALPDESAPHDDRTFLVQLNVCNPCRGCIGLLREQIQKI